MIAVPGPSKTPLLLSALTLVACGTTTPLAREVEIGREAYVVFTGNGRGTGSDLYAVPGRGGRAIQLTYSPVDEFAPALAPDGGAVAFIRQVPNGTRRVWVLNLISGAERQLEPPDSTPPPAKVGWSLDGSAIYVAAENGATWRASAPPRSAETVAVPHDDAGADSALAVLVGSPVFARIDECEPGESLCVVSGADTAPLAGGAVSASRWGGDSVAYFVRDELFVRPLGAGRVRPIEIDAAPRNPRDLTAFGGLAR